MKKKKCALCGKENTNFELQFPSGQVICLDCAKDVYTAVIALATLIKHEEIEK